jgi:hypothetical protein
MRRGKNCLWGILGAVRQGAKPHGRTVSVGGGRGRSAACRRCLQKEDVLKEGVAAKAEASLFCR